MLALASLKTAFEALLQSLFAALPIADRTTILKIVKIKSYIPTYMVYH